MQDALRELLKKAIAAAVEKGQLQLTAVPSIAMDAPREKQHGDFSTNVAMILARQLKVPPPLVAQTLVDNLKKDPAVIEKVEVKNPGFINFFLSHRFSQDALLEIHSRIGHPLPKPKTPLKINVEFVSANPTGPLNVVNARAAALGDVMARMLEACGHQVDREFYVNDEGSQIENLAQSVEFRYKEILGEPAREFPEDWYAGEYVKDLARFIHDGFPDAKIFSDNGKKIYGEKIFSPERLKLLKSGFKDKLAKHLPDEKERLKFLGCASVIRNVHEQEEALGKFRLKFQSWFFQSRLGDRVSRVIEDLKKRDHLYEQDGALWFRTTAFKDDKDRVIVRKEGQPTYFAADIAYHAHKKERGYDRIIDLLGPDHHGYIGRTRASMAALGCPEETLEIYIVQLVTLLSGGKPLRMSKRAGEFITMQDLLEEVGVDAARWYFLARHRDSHLEFDLDLAKLQTEENPLFYAQYAHARIASIIRTAEQQGIRVQKPADLNLSALTHETEMELIKKMGHWPVLLRMAAENREPHHLPRFAVELARTFHSFYTECRVVEPSQKEMTGARLFLASTCKAVLAEILGMMGISAPEKM